MPRKKSKKRMYWDEHVEAGVIAYNETDDPKVRDKIYREDLAYAFDKLSESIINTFKFSYFDVPFEDVKQDVITFLVMHELWAVLPFIFLALHSTPAPFHDNFNITVKNFSEC